MNFYNFKKPHKELKMIVGNDFNELYKNIFNIFIIGKLRIIINYTLHDEMTDNFIIKKNNKNNFVSIINYIGDTKIQIKNRRPNYFYFSKYKDCWTKDEYKLLLIFKKKFPFLFPFVVNNCNILLFNILNNIYHLNGIFLLLSSYIWDYKRVVGKNKIVKRLNIYNILECKNFSKIERLMVFLDNDEEKAYNLLKINNFNFQKALRLLL